MPTTVSPLLEKYIGHANVGQALDVACGTGDMIEIWQKYTNDICGIDPSKGMLEVAKKDLKI